MRNRSPCLSHSRPRARPYTSRRGTATWRPRRWVDRAGIGVWRARLGPDHLGRPSASPAGRSGSRETHRGRMALEPSRRGCRPPSTSARTRRRYLGIETDRVAAGAREPSGPRRPRGAGSGPPTRSPAALRHRSGPGREPATAVSAAAAEAVAKPAIRIRRVRRGRVASESSMASNSSARAVDSSSRRRRGAPAPARGPM